MHIIRKQMRAVLLLVLLSCVPTATHAATPNCFAETTYCIDSTFAPFWQKQGGLAVFGYPIAPASTQIIAGIPIFAQYFERARLEIHVDSAGGTQITLGRIGAELRGQIEYQGAPGDASCLFFAQTNQSVCEPFRAMYLRYGLESNGKRGWQFAENLALFGVPISAPQRISMPDGEYVSQWFERAQMRYHVDTPTVVTLGLIGVERLAQTNPPSTSATPITVAQPLTFTGSGSFLSAPIPLPRGEITLTISKNSNATVQLIDGRGRIQTVYNNFNLTNLTPSIYNDTGGDWYLVISGTKKYWQVSLAVSTVNQALAFQYGGTGTVDSDTFTFDKTQTGLYSVHYGGSGYFLMQMRCNGKTTTLVSMTNSGDAVAVMSEVPGTCRWVIKSNNGGFIIYRLKSI
jgi:hypothetical protein